jgi:diacylglycerol kinase (ATP)
MLKSSTICVIFNPAARGEKAGRELRLLRALGAGCVFRPTESAGSAALLASEAAAEGFTTVVAAGGDGTVNEVVNGLAEDPENFQRVRLGVLPLGSTNVFALDLGIPCQFEAAWKIIQEGRERRIDLPLARFEINGVKQRRYFAQLAGAGLDAIALTLVKWKWKRRHPFMAYLLAGAQAMGQPKCLVNARFPRETTCGQFVLLGNGRFYGGRLPLFPRASYDDGLLDVCVFPRMNWLTLIRYGLGFLSARLLWRREVFFQTPEVTLESTAPVLFQLDGEVAGRLPVHFTLSPRLLRVIAACGYQSNRGCHDNADKGAHPKSPGEPRRR